MPQSMTYAALFLMMTWADAELAFRGRGPPPVPSRMSLVLVVWLWALYRCENAATKVAVPVRNARRLQAGMCRLEAESYGRLIVMNVGVVGGAHCTTMRRMAMGKRKRERQPTMSVLTTDLPMAMSHPL